jgi:hypothetical protein
MVAAMIASIGCPIAHAMVFALHLTLGTEAHAVRNALFFDVFEARGIVRELVVEVPDGVAQFLWDMLFNFVGVHNGKILADALLVVKGYLPWEGGALPVNR